MAKKLLIFGSLFVLLCTALFIVNETAQFVSLVNTVSPVAGKITLICLLAAYAAILFVPVMMFVRLPKAIRPPEDERCPEYRIYLDRLGARLADNPHLAGAGVQANDRSGIEAALKILDARAGEIIEKTASSLFISTAVSQNGRLDALMVLMAQTRMIWQVAHIYNQRPMLREFIQLYANVGATLFAASQLEDLDISEQVEPVIKAAVGGSVASVVPGIASIASIVMHAVLEGTANAYLTLRVGIICRTYCGSTTAFNRGRARRYSSITAAAMLGSIVTKSAGNVVKAIVTAARKAGGSTVESAAAGIRGVGARLNPFGPLREK